MGAQVERQQSQQQSVFMEGEMLCLPAHRRTASADFLCGTEEGAAGERVLIVIEQRPVGFGDGAGGVVQKNFHCS